MTALADVLTDDELSALTDDELDGIVDGHDTFTRVMDEAGLCRIAQDYRAWKRSLRDERVWARFTLAGMLICERPFRDDHLNHGKGEPGRAWDWSSGRTDASAPSDHLLTDSPS